MEPQTINQPTQLVIETGFKKSKIATVLAVIALVLSLIIFLVMVLISIFVAGDTQISGPSFSEIVTLLVPIFSSILVLKTKRKYLYVLGLTVLGFCALVALFPGLISSMIFLLALIFSPQWLTP